MTKANESLDQLVVEKTYAPISRYGKIAIVSFALAFISTFIVSMQGHMDELTLIFSIPAATLGWIYIIFHDVKGLVQRAVYLVLVSVANTVFVKNLLDILWFGDAWFDQPNHSNQIMWSWILLITSALLIIAAIVLAIAQKNPGRLNWG